MNLIKKNIFIIIFSFVLFYFFSPFIIKGLLPVPADTIVGLYHPFRDLYSDRYPRGIPYKNPLITDPVRQIIPWKNFVIDEISKFSLPLWNPYEMAGKPLLANFQSSVFYPLNLILFIKPFSIAWSIFIIIQPLMAGIFLYLYLRFLNINKLACLTGSLAFSFSGFSVSWLEWGNIGHTALWLPLILLSIDKVFYWFNIGKNSKLKTQNSKPQIKNQILLWSFLLFFSFTISFFAGHLQIFLYLFVFSTSYFIARWIQYGRKFNILFAYLIFTILFLILTSIQWIPTLQFILLSSRSIDQSMANNPGWFLPWQHLMQFIAPDFFGNPATDNYWGVWNYAELVGYIGVIPLIFALFAMFTRFDKKTLFFGFAFFTSLIFALPTPLAKIPFILNVPFLSTSQPTRLLFITCFSLSILASLGFDYFLKERKKLHYPLLFIGIVITTSWLFNLFGQDLALAEDINTAKRNLILPTLIFISFVGLIMIYSNLKKTGKTVLFHYIIIGLVAFDLLRFGIKFTPFTQKEYFFPLTKTVEFLQKQQKPFRIATTDSRIFPPNFSTYYKIESIEGYDPLYLLRYGQLIAASERGKPDISPPFGFNRIITPHNIGSKLIDLLNVKYVLSLDELNSDKLVKVFEEGQTKVYEKINFTPRAFFVENVKVVSNKQQAIQELFDNSEDSKKTAILESQYIHGIDPKKSFNTKFSLGQVNIIEYNPNSIKIEVENKGEGFLVLLDAYYPQWKARVKPLGNNNNLKDLDLPIFLTDYSFRGVAIPEGSHIIEFYTTLF